MKSSLQQINNLDGLVIENFIARHCSSFQPLPILPKLHDAFITVIGKEL